MHTLWSTKTTEIASITANIDTLKVDLKEKKSALKKVEKEVASLEVKKARADAKAAEEAKKAEAESVVKKLGIECEPIRVDDYTGKKMTFFHDPDGLPLELHE